MKRATTMHKPPQFQLARPELGEGQPNGAYAATLCFMQKK